MTASRFSLFLCSSASLFLCLSVSPPLSAAPFERPIPDGRLNPGEPVEVKIVSPEMDQVLKDSRVEVVLKVKNFDVRENGPHLHLVLDNRPFQEHFQSEAPFVFSNVSAGTHVLAVFPVTSWHESWRNEEALAIVRFQVLSKDPDPGVDLSGPLLIFNMPQRTNRKWAGRLVLFDFLTLNVEAESGTTQMSGFRIRYRLDGKEHVTEYLESHFWLNLDRGEHRIEVWLTDSRGRFFPNGNWNWTGIAFRVTE